MSDKTVLAFTLNGVLTRPRFDELLWHDEIPKLYAAQHGKSIKEAKRDCFAAYYRSEKLERGEHHDDLAYWFDRLNLRTDWQDIVDDMQDRVSVYPEVRTVLPRFQEEYHLIILSTAHPKYLEAKVAAEGLDNFVEHAVSTHELGASNLTLSVCRLLCDKLEVNPGDLILITDPEDRVTQRAGDPAITTHVIDRDHNTADRQSLSSLTALTETLEHERHEA